MGKDFFSFSPCGKHFVHCGPDGKLNLWDTVTGALKQDYVPNVHLTSPCCSLAWMSVSGTTILSRKNRKRKHEIKENKVIALGTMGGLVALYSIPEKKIVTSLQGGHSSPVSSVFWMNEVGLFSAADNLVVHWDVANKSIKSKWKCGKGKISCLTVSPDGELCVTASCGLKMWQVNSQTLLKSFIGHSSEITNLIFVNEQYILSAAQNDRHISVWNTTSESEEPVGKFAVSNSINGKVSVTENSDCLQIAAATASGSLEIFNHQLNGKCGKPVKPSLTIEIALEKLDGASVESLPIVASCLMDSKVWISYGFSPKFSFEAIDTAGVKEKRMCLVRSEATKSMVNNVKVGENITENVEYVSGGVKRKAGGKAIDVPMEERLINLSIDHTDSGSTSKPLPHNMSQLLMQGLESKDRSILESVLLRKDPLTISETVSRIPLHALCPLLKELLHMLQGKTLTSAIASAWLKCVVMTHAGHLLTDTHACDLLTKLNGILETRLLVLPTLTSLSGRLNLLLQQLEEPSEQNVQNVDALLVYQDEESSDEGSSHFAEVEGSESEDRWEELSDREEDTEDAAMST